MFGFGKKVSKSEKLKFFMLVRSLLGLGLTILQAIEFVAKNETNKSKKKSFEEKIRLVKNEGAKIENILRDLGYLEDIEYLILKNSKDSKKAIEDIIEFQSKHNIFEKTVVSIFAFPVLTILILNSLLIVAQPKILEFLDFIAEQQKVTSGVKPEFSIPIFLQDYDALINSLIITSSTLVILVSVYFILYYKKPWLIYKAFPLKNLDDAPLIISTMVKINATTGMGMADVAKQMKQFVNPKALSIMFDSIIQRVNENRHFYPVFMEYGFKKELVDFIEIGEKSQNLWKNMAHVVTLAKELGEQKVTLLNMTLKPMMKYIAYSIIVITLFQIFMLYFVITTGLM